MTDKMVTIARFTDTVEAAMARNRLEDVGIRCALNNEEAAIIGWQLTSSIGTIELLVQESDAEAALEALRYPHLSLGQIQRRSEVAHPEGIVEPESVPTQQTDITTPEGIEEDKEEPVDPAEEKVDRAFKAALFGYLVFPPLLHFYALFLLADFVWGGESLPPSRKLKAWGAFLICLPVLVLVAWLLVLIGGHMVE